MRALIHLTLALCLSTLSLNATPLSVGDQMPELNLKVIGSDEPLALRSLQGQLVVTEFWATWCSPCIRSMQHLKALEEHFGDQLTILAVSDEKEARIASFMQHTGFPFLFVQEAETLGEYFPHRVIPHTVVLSPQQEVVAITEPEALTEELLRNILQGKAVEMPIKADQPWDVRIDIFDLDTLAQQSFQIQPARPEAPTYSRNYKGQFAGRRRSFVNFQVPMLYREAYQTTAYRMVYPERENPDLYCVDILVVKGEEGQLEQKLRDSLAAYFGWEASWEPVEMEAWVLSALPSGIQLPKTDTPANSTAGGDHFKSAGARPAAFADYLESFGIAGMPVVDETDSAQLYRFDFSFEPENPDSFFQALTDMGLAVKKERRRIDILTLRPPRG